MGGSNGSPRGAGVGKSEDSACGGKQTSVHFLGLVESGRSNYDFGISLDISCNVSGRKLELAQLA